MKIRHYRKEDAAAIEAMHKAQGFDYRLPDFSKPEYFMKVAIERDDKSLAMALFLRTTAEAFLIADPNHDSKREKIQQLLILDREVTPLVKKAEYNEVHCFLPPGLDKRFGRFLGHIGWVEGNVDWTLYAKELG